MTSCIFDFDNCVREIPSPNVLECCAKELLLKIRSDIGNDDDHSGMQRFSSMKIKEIRRLFVTNV